MSLSRRNRKYLKYSNFKEFILFFQEDVGAEQLWAFTTPLSFILIFVKTKCSVQLEMTSALIQILML